MYGPRNMSPLRRAVLAVCLLWVLGACGTCGVYGGTSASNGPSQTELAAATVTGSWALTVLVDSYTGPPPPATDAMKPGHKGVDRVVFVSQCPSAGQCTLQLWGASGPDPATQAYYAFYSSATGLLGPPVSTPMTRSAATYTQAIPISGFGGVKCPPSRTVPRPEQRLSLTVTNASGSGSSWSATALTGAETFVAGWGCSGTSFTGWTVGRLKITGKAG